MPNVQTAVARRDEERAAAPATLGEFVQMTIERQAVELSSVLPEHLDTRRYSALVLTAVKANDKLMAAFRTEQGQLSVLLSVMQAAALGLEPNTPMQECWLQPRRNQGADECELSIGYKGYAKLARRSGKLKALVADVVRDGDDFRWSRGLGEDEFHHRKLTDDGELTHAYCIARMHDGSVAFTVMTRTQVEKRRAMSESWKSEKARPYSPWTKWEEEQWRKTAIRQLLLHGEVDLSPEIISAASTDESALHVAQGGMIEALVANEARAELEPPAGNGDRQGPASPSTFAGEGEPADPGSYVPSKGDPPASDDTDDPANWTEEEWRRQLAARKIKIPEALTQAQRFATEQGLEPGPTSIDELAGHPVAGDLAAWIGL